MLTRDCVSTELGIFVCNRMCVIVEVYIYSFRWEELDMFRVSWSGCVG